MIKWYWPAGLYNVDPDKRLKTRAEYEELATKLGKDYWEDTNVFSLCLGEDDVDADTLETLSDNEIDARAMAFYYWEFYARFGYYPKFE
jgi:transcription initiation factor TFIID subunit TAF12